MSAKNIDRVSVYAGIEEVLMKLKTYEQVKLVVATSKTTQDYEEGFKFRYKIGQLFDAYVTADDTVAHKPNPAPILAGMAKVDVGVNNSIYIGDTVHDLKAARAAKIKFGAAMWGTTQADKLVDADYLLNEPSDLLKLV